MSNDIAAGGLPPVARAIERDSEDRSRREHIEALHARLRCLTPSERKVFDRVVRGKLNKQIGDELDTTERTVKWHRHNLMDKLGAGSLAELVSMAERMGLLGPRAGDDAAPR